MAEDGNKEGSDQIKSTSEFKLTEDGTEECTDQTGTTPEPTLSCVYHSPKSRSIFQHLLNLNRNLKLIPKLYVNKVGGAVCTCNKYAFHDEIDDQMLDDVKHSVAQELLSNLDKKALAPIGTVLKSMKDIQVTDADRFDRGYYRLVYVLAMALKNDFESLDYSRYGSNVSKASGGGEFPFEYRFKVKFPLAYISYIVGKHGCHIKQFNRMNKCELRVTDNSRMAHRTADAELVNFVVKTETDSHGKNVEKELIKITTRIVKSREAHLKRMTEHWAKIRLERAARYQTRVNNEAQCGVGSSFMAASHMKESAKDNYSTKYRHMLKDRSARRFEKTQIKPGVLEETDARCAQCLIPYSREVPNPVGQCKYHPGYLKKQSVLKIKDKYIVKKNSWSCCYKEIDRHVTAKESHEETGCATGRHLWRPRHKVHASRNHEKSSDAKQAWCGMKSKADGSRAKQLANIIDNLNL